MKTRDVAQEMIAYRARNGLTQFVLAEMMGVNYNTISNMETRKYVPRATTVALFDMLLEKEEKEKK